MNNQSIQTNHNNSPALNQQILNLPSQQTESNFFGAPIKNPLKNLRTHNSEILPFVGLGLLGIYFLYTRR